MASQTLCMPDSWLICSGSWARHATMLSRCERVEGPPLTATALRSTRSMTPIFLVSPPARRVSLRFSMLIAGLGLSHNKAWLRCFGASSESGATAVEAF